MTNFDEVQRNEFGRKVYRYAALTLTYKHTCYDNNLWTSLCNSFLVSVLSLFFSAASCMNPDKNNLLYFNKQAAYLGYLWHSLASPIMILPVLLNAWCWYLALKECDIVFFKL